VEEHPFPRRIKAPELSGGVAWINTGGPLEIRDLKGKFVLLDFWTYCCINCMHILPELKKLEQAYPNELVVIGVHSAKFETERDSKNITDAVLRYEIEHPVINDAMHTVWNNYGVQSWPSLRIVDPEGQLVAGHGGEIDFETLDVFLKRALPYYRQKGTLDETPLRFDLEQYRAADTPLRFPGKVLADGPGNRLFIADSNHNRLVVTTLDGELITLIGSGAIGTRDGDYKTAQFNHPQGMALLDQTLYVADTENHLLRKIDLKAQKVTTIAGVGTQGRNAWPGLDPEARFAAPASLPERFVGPPKTTGLNSPWALWVHGADLYIAMAGPHQIWKMPLDESEIGPYAGNGREDIVDGRLLPRQPYQQGYSAFAQPSGLASDGKRLYVADSEGSSIRSVPFDPTEEVTTLVGTSNLPQARLFTFGDVDGTGADVLLQHALGLVYDQGTLYLADTYNNKIKALDVKSTEVRTIAGDRKPGSSDDPGRFDEPAGISLAAGKLYVADTNNHRIRTITLDGHQVATLEIQGLAPPKKPREKAPGHVFPNVETQTLKTAAVQPQEGHVRFQVKLNLPPGTKFNPDAPMGYVVTAKGDGPLERAALDKFQRIQPPAQEFEIRLPVAQNTGQQDVQVSVIYYHCQEGAQGLCKVGSVQWNVPLDVGSEGAPPSVTLEHTVK
jgi:thiol-disulfide isomerase/thioredoxin